jgi:hypothetical protein
MTTINAMQDLVKPFAMQLYDLGPDLTALQIGMPQQSGPMTVLPVFGPGRGDADASGAGSGFAAPLSGLKLGGVKRGYGNVELHNPGPSAGSGQAPSAGSTGSPQAGSGRGGVTIVPLHVGYIQDGAQNHALCRSGFVGAGQHVLFQDACCVQAAQGGFLESREQWFFILPLALREEALLARGVVGFGKLWPAIAKLNARLGLEQRGHLEQIVCRQRPTLTQYQSRFELLPGQTGALFLLRDRLAGDRLVGVEIAPTADYFRELWMPLVCFCYGTAAMELERHDAARQPAAQPQPFAASSLAELRPALAESRRERLGQVHDALARTPAERFQKQEEERFLDLRLFTALGQNFAGQYVEQDGRLVYVSLTARSKYLPGLN